MSFQLSAIDNEELVHDAVRNGHVISLEIYLNQNPECINKLFIHNKSKWTPLLAACFYKHEHVVHMLLTRFKVDVEAIGDIYFDFPNNQSQLVKEVSPLWTAIAVDHFPIVKLLIEHGNANVKHLTEQQSTTFRIACYMSNLDTARYLVEHGADPYQARKGNFTSLMLAVTDQNLSIIDYLLNELKCDINEQDENGQTALYYAIKLDSVDVAKILLEHGALNICDYRRKVTPLMRAALFGQISFVDAFQGYCSELEWIEAKELLAASFSGCIARLENLNKTTEYLTEAFVLRLAHNFPKQITAEPLKMFHYRRECETLEQFNQLLCSDIKDTLYIEGLLIHQRLLGDNQKDYHDVIHHYGASLALIHRYHECLCWWFYEFDLKQKYNIIFKDDYLQNFILLFVRMKFNDHINIPIEDLLRMFKIMNYVLVSDCYSKNFDSNLIILLQVITIVAQIIYNENLEEKQELSTEHCRDLCRSIGFFIREQYKTRESGSSLLHLCLNPSTESISFYIDYPCWMTTCLLIDCGTDVNALDIHGNTPLHILAQGSPSSNAFKMIDRLCDAGAHLDYVNEIGLIPLESVPLFCFATMERLKQKMDVVRLKCLCARLIRQQQFLYQNILSTSLVNFIQKH